MTSTPSRIPSQSPRKHGRQRHLKYGIQLTVGGRESPAPEDQDPKQGKAATASGKLGEDKEQFGKSQDKEKQASEKTLEGLPSNPERPARV
jgi:hypothetical protein